MRSSTVKTASPRPGIESTLLNEKAVSWATDEVVLVVVVEPIQPVNVTANSSKNMFEICFICSICMSKYDIL